LNRKKYIEKKSGKRSQWNQLGYNRQRSKQINPDLLPKRESMRYNSRNSWDSHRNFVNWDHMRKYFKTKVGENWDDVYSDMLSKLKEKYKYEYRENSKWNYFIETKIIIVDDLPYNTWGHLTVNCVFVDENNILSYYETEEALKTEYKIRLRKKKFLNIIDF
jgi:hypothetical protein